VEVRAFLHRSLSAADRRCIEGIGVISDHIPLWLRYKSLRDSLSHRLVTGGIDEILFFSTDVAALRAFGD
jgi:hypothetical protein